MEERYGIQLNGMLLEKYETPVEAYKAAQFAYEETGVFHEVILVSSN